MVARAERHLAAGRNVVLDATFLERRQHGPVVQAAAAAGVPLLALHVTAPDDVVRARMRARELLPGLSDARWDTYIAQRDHSEPLDDLAPARVVALDGSQPLERLVDAALRALAARRAP
jgi:predicted kinase